jgi:hypothetical protein
MTYVLRIKAETTEEQMKVLEVFEKEGYLWRGLQLPTKFIPIHRYGKQYIYIEADKEFKKLATTEAKYKDKSVEELTFKDFLARRKKVIL